jgi:hypothetical protein
MWLDNDSAYPNSGVYRTPDSGADPDRHTYSGANGRPHTDT